MTMKKVYVKNIPQTASEDDVKRSLSIFGHISNCELEKHQTRGDYNAGHGFVEFMDEDGAKRCITNSRFNPPKCMEKILSVSSNTKKKAKKIYGPTFDVKITLSSLEIGNWGGRSSIVLTNEKGKKRENKSNPQFTFLSEWR